MTARALILAALGLVLEPSSARADADEASVHVHLVGGAARMGDELAGGRTRLAPLAGIAGRFTFARSDWHAWEAALSFAQTGAARFSDVTTTYRGDTLTGELARSARLARVSLGGTLRLGVRFIPTLHADVGAQLRLRGPATLTAATAAADVVGSEASVDLVATALAGLDYRLSARWVVGVAAGATHAIPLCAAALDTFEAFVHVSRYWYPRW